MKENGNLHFGTEVKKEAKGLLAGSFINNILGKVSDYIYYKAETSNIARVVETDNSLKNLSSKSLFAILVNSFIQKLNKYRRNIAKSVEESLILDRISAFFRYLMSLNLISWGTGLFFYGLLVSGISILKAYNTQGEVNIGSGMLYGVVFIVIGILIMANRMSLYNALTGSRILGYLIFDIAGVRRDQIATDKTINSPIVPCIISALMAVTTLYVPAYYAPIALIALIVATLIINITEFGVVILFLAIPFISTMQAAALSLFVILSFILKLIRGKRNIKFDKMDVAVLFFMISLLTLGFLSSLNPSKSMFPVFLYILFISVYFVIANTLRSKKWSLKAIYALIISGTFSAIIGIYQNFVGLEQSLIWVDTSMFSDISARVIGTFENPNVFGEFLIMIIPLSFVSLIKSKRMGKYGPLVSLFFMGLSLIYTYSRGAWLAFLVSFFLFLLFLHKGFMKISVIGVFALPFLPMVLPASIVNRLLSIGNMADSSTAYRVNIWVGTMRMLKDYWLTGIGTGTDIFLSVYPSYALSGAAYAQHPHNLYLHVLAEIGIMGFICLLCVILLYFKRILSSAQNVKDRDTKLFLLALGAGIFAFLLQGLTDNVWYNYRIFLIFWSLLGLAVGIYRGYQLEWGRVDEY